MLYVYFFQVQTDKSEYQISVSKDQQCVNIYIYIYYMHCLNNTVNMTSEQQILPSGFPAVSAAQQDSSDAPGNWN